MFPFNAARFGSIAALSSAADGSTSVIKSITPGSITMAAASGSGTFTSLPSIDTTKSILLYNGRTGNGAGTAYARVGTRLAITNGTTVTATRETSTTDAVTVYFTVIEFASGVNGIYAGSVTVAVGNTSGTDSTIGHSIGANSFIIWQGLSSVTGASDSANQAGLTVNTSTGVVTATTGQAVVTSDQHVGWMVADLDSTIVVGIATSPLTAHTAAAVTDSDVISSVTTTQSILVWGGMTTAASAQTVGRVEYTVQLTGATAVTATRQNGTDVASRTHYYTAVQFNASILNQNVQRPTPIAITAAASNTATITSLANWSATSTLNKAFVNWNGFEAASANINVVEPSLVLTSATVVTAALNSSGTVLGVGFEAVEFK